MNNDTIPSKEDQEVYDLWQIRKQNRELKDKTNLSFEKKVMNNFVLLLDAMGCMEYMIEELQAKYVGNVQEELKRIENHKLNLLIEKVDQIYNKIVED
tara:strand:+ start:3501 stop:3794 length:294 start_codon:yes stop_codon:yes gene_type:complete